MFKRVIWPLLIVGILYLAYAGLETTTDRLSDVQDHGPSVEEEILSDGELFFDEFSQRLLLRLKAAETEKLGTVERVPEPGPSISEVIEWYGEPDKVEQTELTSTREQVAIYHYGRLGLATPRSREDGAVFWVLIE